MKGMGLEEHVKEKVLRGEKMCRWET